MLCGSALPKLRPIIKVEHIMVTCAIDRQPKLTPCYKVANSAARQGWDLEAFDYTDATPRVGVFTLSRTTFGKQLPTTSPLKALPLEKMQLSRWSQALNQ
jgi:hypothetical protein